MHARSGRDYARPCEISLRSLGGARSCESVRDRPLPEAATWSAALDHANARLDSRPNSNANAKAGLEARLESELEAGLEAGPVSSARASASGATSASASASLAAVKLREGSNASAEAAGRREEPSNGRREAHLNGGPYEGSRGQLLAAAANTPNAPHAKASTNANAGGGGGGRVGGGGGDVGPAACSTSSLLAVAGTRDLGRSYGDCAIPWELKADSSQPSDKPLGLAGEAAAGGAAAAGCGGWRLGGRTSSRDYFHGWCVLQVIKGRSSREQPSS